jgi:aerobic-type carbon monoxide dehydrogenase small subunit (CoxS/CutS family)
MLLAAHALIERTAGELTREQIAEALRGHVCRCTGYVNILAAVADAGAAR